MPKIKPFVWENSSVAYTIFAATGFGSYVISEFSVEEAPFYLMGFGKDLGRFETVELAKRFAFDDFRKRLEEILGEPVGYDLEIDENC